MPSRERERLAFSEERETENDDATETMTQCPASISQEATSKRNRKRTWRPPPPLQTGKASMEAGPQLSDALS